MNTYEWTPTECSVPDQMMEIVHGEYTTIEGDKIQMAKNVIINSEWGAPNSEYIQGDERKGIPENVELTWYSFSEDAFYTLNERLPDLSTYFEKGLYDGSTGSFEPLGSICLGFAPGGHVNVWLQNMDQSILLVSFNGKLTDLDWKTTMDVGATKEEFLDEVQREYRMGGHDSYTEQEILSFNRLKEVELEFHLKGTPGVLAIEYFNGEKKRYVLDQLKCSIPYAGPMKQIDLSVDTEHGKRRIVIDLNKEEILETWAECREKLIFRSYINIFSNEVKIDVHCGDRTRNLSQFKSSLYLQED